MSTASTSWLASSTLILYNGVYGLRGSVLRLTVYGDGRQLRDTTYIDDLVDVLVLAGASYAADGHLGSVYVDDTKIQKILGWQPRVDWADGLRQTVAFYRAHRAHYLSERGMPAVAV